MSTYREELCNKDERGIPVFSPFCVPGRTVDTNLASHVYSKADLEKLNAMREKYNTRTCHIPPVAYPQRTVTAYDDSASAQDWFKDPTYAQHVARRLYVTDKGLQEDESRDSGSLKAYRTAKTMEKVAGSLMQTM